MKYCHEANIWKPCICFCPMQDIFFLCLVKHRVSSPKRDLERIHWHFDCAVFIVFLIEHNIFIVKAEWVKCTITSYIVLRLIWPFTDIYCASLSAIKEQIWFTSMVTKRLDEWLIRLFLWFGTIIWKSAWMSTQTAELAIWLRNLSCMGGFIGNGRLRTDRCLPWRSAVLNLLFPKCLGCNVYIETEPRDL